MTRPCCPDLRGVLITEVVTETWSVLRTEKIVHSEEVSDLQKCPQREVPLYIRSGKCALLSRIETRSV